MKKVVSLFLSFVTPPARWRQSCVRLLLLGTIVLFISPAMAGDYELGLKLYEEGAYAKAANFLRSAVEETSKNPDSNQTPNVRYYLADTYLKLSRFSEAQAEYQTILAIAPDSQAARMSRIALSNLKSYLSSTSNQRWNVVSGLGKSGGSSDRYVGPIGTEGDYLDEVTENGRIVRWAIPTMPLKLYVEESPSGIQNFQPGFVSQVRRAMDVWVAGLGHQISYVLVSEPGKADIRVNWVNSIDTKGHSEDGGTAYTAGLMLPRLRDEQIQTMDVRIATFDILGREQTSEIIYAVAIHELGHALGLLGHSPSPNDIMSVQNKRVNVPSARDLNTIRRLYQLPPDISNLPRSQQAPTPNRDREIAAKLDASITKLETQVKSDDMELSWLNLSVSYYQKAKLLQKQDNPASSPDKNPAFWYNKALNAINQAIQREPKDPKAYHKRALIYQELDSYNPALLDIQKAITLDRNEPDYYMLQAWFLAKLKQPAQARSSLDTYLLYKPGEANSADVQQIREALSQKP